MTSQPSTVRNDSPHAPSPRVSTAANQRPRQNHPQHYPSPPLSLTGSGADDYSEHGASPHAVAYQACSAPNLTAALAGNPHLRPEEVAAMEAENQRRNFEAMYGHVAPDVASHLGPPS